MKKDYITIRSATQEDVPAIAKMRSDAIQNIQHKAYSQSVLDEWDGPTEDFIKKLLSNLIDVCVVAEIGNGNIIGYGELEPAKNLLRGCYVLSSAGGRGIGTSIVTELERIARQKGLKYIRIDSSINAEPFYSRCGYQIIEHSKYTLESGTIIDCVKMRKDLSE